jgi:predicted transposase YbfD/YdcC
VKYSLSHLDVNVEPQGFCIDVGSLYEALARVPDHRHARGLRYALVTVLVFIVLAKLAGQDRVSGIAEWIALRIEALSHALHLVRVRAPHRTTYSNLLGKVIDVAEFETVVQDFFASQPGAGQSVVINLDGKTLRGTIPAGQSHGVHLLAAFLPDEGWVLMQVEVDRKENEIRAAARVLGTLDLRDKIVTGDALLAQRTLSAQIVEAGGDYVWTVKENQSQLYQDLETLFAPELVAKGFSPASHDDFRTARIVDKGHGRLETRTLTVSQALTGYTEWPHAAQVFRLERRILHIGEGKRTEETVYGITSLSPAEASPKRLLQLVRKHWGIENKLHYRRDETMREDWCHLRKGHAGRMMASLNNLVLGLLLRRGVTNVPQARRHHDHQVDEAVRLILSS